LDAVVAFPVTRGDEVQVERKEATFTEAVGDPLLRDAIGGIAHEAGNDGEADIKLAFR
jgi:hypothetical protein